MLDKYRNDPLVERICDEPVGANFYEKAYPQKWYLYIACLLRGLGATISKNGNIESQCRDLAQIWCLADPMGQANLMSGEVDGPLGPMGGLNVAHSKTTTRTPADISTQIRDI